MSPVYPDVSCPGGDQVAEAAVAEVRCKGLVVVAVDLVEAMVRAESKTQA